MAAHEPLEYREAESGETDLDPEFDRDVSYDDLSRMRERLPDEYLRWRREELLERAYPAFLHEIPHDYGGPRETSVVQEDTGRGRP